MLGGVMLGWPTLRPLLAFVVGFVDTAVFVHMGGLFVAHVTGNFVLLGATLAGTGASGAHAGAATLQLLSFPIFIGSAALAAMIASWVAAQKGDFTPPLLWIAAVFMLGAAALAFFGVGFDAAASMILVAAMAVLNCVHRLDTRIGPPFTVMTGNVTGLSIALAQRLGLASGLPPAKGSGPMLLLVVAFGIGAATGALGVSRFALGLGAIALPGALLAIHLLFGGKLETA